jgi:hypothetical protein
LDKKQAMSLEQHFTDIYHKNTWHGKESKSGTGSDLINARKFSTKLAEVINSLNINTMLDVPCGDFNWMKTIIEDLDIKSYLGADIVKEMIADNQKKYHFPNRVRFLQIDVVNEIVPKSDLIFCRDCLVHFSYETAKQILRNFVASESKYLIMTTFTANNRNAFDIQDGQWRALNFEMPPFNLPHYSDIINEHCEEDSCRWTDKCLGLWRLEDIREIIHE